MMTRRDNKRTWQCYASGDVISALLVNILSEWEDADEGGCDNEGTRTHTWPKCGNNGNCTCETNKT